MHILGPSRGLLWPYFVVYARTIKVRGVSGVL